ncbi:hypothetical protein H6P81_015238 [Aristolochia fimbriata]|uniref:Nuclease associated modular domain-containing protein n=1 Tax=Aristolochia fimbriata TaxID=158543 RepID=A0AAV7E9H3_ARIFI|nr:hypothetical protein H6P81_015238 [Aristolochia fimbriata]
MHSVDFATTGSCLQNHLGPSRIHHPCPFRGNTADICVFGKEKRSCSAWKVYIHTPRKPNFYHWFDAKKSLHPMAIATLETKVVSYNEHGPAQGYSLELDTNLNSQGLLTLNDDSAELDEREKLRRQRISKANKGNVPWNKGRKHSAETLQRIREKTRLAMQHPKVKMKLVNLGHAQSEETRIKIGVGVRMGWQRRREKLMVQETCCLKWQNLIAEASRKGYSDADELQWDSYEILDEQLKEEWLESIEMRKSMPRPKGSKRAPKSPEQRKKISEAISAKWADPDYRSRVCSALSQYHGTPVGAVRKPRRKPSTEPSTVRKSPAMKSAESHKRGVTDGKPKKKKPPSYKDPLANSKLEMIKKIRAERITMETRTLEAMDRARLLIAEAEKAAKALEPAALISSLARASLLETRRLIAEATSSLEAIESGQLVTTEGGNNNNSSFIESNGVIDDFRKDPASGRNDIISDSKGVNGTPVLPSNSSNSGDLNFGKIALQNMVAEREQLSVTLGVEEIEARIPGHVSHFIPAEDAMEWPQTKSKPQGFQEAEGAEKNEQPQSEYVRGASTKVGTSTATTSKKKWVCGRLVEVVDE